MKYPSLPVIPDAFQSIDTYEKAYVLGFLLADGCVREPGKRSGFRVTLRILAEDLKVCQMLQEIVGGHLRLIEGGYRIEWDASCRFLASDLIAYGVTPRKSHTVAINWERIPQHLHGAVLAGLIDGDGNLRFNRKERRAGISVLTASPYLRDQLLERFRFFKLQVQRVSIHLKTELYTLIVESNRALLREAIQRIYDPLPFPILDRKLTVLQEIRGYLAEQDAYDERMAKVPEMKAAGLTIKEIAERLGVGLSAIGRRLKAADIDSRQLVFTDEDRQQMKWMHERGMSVLQIHAAIGKATEQAVRYQMQKMGCLTRTKKALPRSPHAVEILRRHQAGETAQQIAKDIGMANSTVSRILQREGVTLKGGSPQKLTEEMVCWADGQLRQGRTLKSVAQELGVSETLIRFRRKAMGLGGS